MLKSILHILNNEDGWIFMAIAAVTAIASAESGRKRDMETYIGDMKLQRARAERARNRSAANYSEASSAAKEAGQKREIAIESSRLDAESKIDETMAGSGISGTSVNEIDSELNAAVEKNKYQSEQATDKQLSGITRKYAEEMEDINFKQSNADHKPPEFDTIGALGGAVSAASGFSGAVGKMQTQGKKEGVRSKDSWVNSLGNFLAI